MKTLEKEEYTAIFNGYETLLFKLGKLTSILHETDPENYVEMTNISDIDYYTRKNDIRYIELTGEEYHVGCGDYENDYCEFPEEWIWTDQDDVVKIVIEKRIEREELKKREKESHEEKKQIELENKELELLKKLKTKYE